jgi:hypothetical protein
VRVGVVVVGIDGVVCGNDAAFSAELVWRSVRILLWGLIARVLGQCLTNSSARTQAKTLNVRALKLGGCQVMSTRQTNDFG